MPLGDPYGDDELVRQTLREVRSEVLRPGLGSELSNTQRASPFLVGFSERRFYFYIGKTPVLNLSLIHI